jgi:glycosyltransferase involved in cell wall biosynthesis/GT2 family glycosyltransferase
MPASTGLVPGLTVAVCTYRRASALTRLLSALAEQPHPVREIVIVDASPDDATEAAVLQHPMWSQGQRGWYVRVGPAGRGLPRQRNLALDLVTSDLVVFFDDDVVPLPGCLAAMEEALRTEPDLVGTGARMVPEAGQPAASNRTRMARLRHRLGILPTLEPGRYHRTGMSTVWDDTQLTTPLTRGDWLPGYAAMWRTEIAQQVRYADDFAGYAQGEDLEFSLRAGRHGAMALVTAAAVVDHHDLGGRPDPFELGYMAVRNRVEIHRRGLPDRTRRDVARLVYAWTVDSLILALGLLRPRSVRTTAAQLAGRTAAARDAALGSPMRTTRASSAAPPALDPARVALCVVGGSYVSRDASGAWVGIGGFPLQMAALAEEFASLTVIAPDNGALDGTLAFPATVEVVAVPDPPGNGLVRKLALILLLPRYLPPIVRGVRRSDAVHVPLPGDLPLLGLAVAVLLRRPLLVRWCSAWEDNGHTTRMNRVVKALLRRLAGRSRTVVLATGLGSQPAAPGVAWIPSSPLSVVELAGHGSDLARPLGQPARLAFIGRLAPEKGLDVLLTAVAELRRSGRAATLVVMGEGPERAAVERQVAELGLQDAVELTGRVDRHELNERLAEADLAVQPSRSEGFSKAWLDALANGVPVVASTAGGMAEPFLVANEVGWTVPPDDADQLAQTLAAILDHPSDLPALRERCRAVAEANTLEGWAAAMAEHCRVAWATSARHGRARL